MLTSVVRAAGRWILRGVGSRNGTRVNGRRVLDQVRLRPGDEITVSEARRAA
jgi:pSer/pThr/pTyr-binding forkhead associated (FHA) protein